MIATIRLLLCAMLVAAAHAAPRFDRIESIDLTEKARGPGHLDKGDLHGSLGNWKYVRKICEAGCVTGESACAIAAVIVDLEALAEMCITFKEWCSSGAEMGECIAVLESACSRIG
eukprot:gene31654-6851_t